MYFTSLLLLGVLFLPLFQSSRSDGSKDVKEELLRIEKQIGKANLECDYKFFRATEADEFFFTDSSGHVTTREQDLAGEKDCKKHQGSYQVDDTNVLVYGSTAVVAGLGTYIVTNPEGKIVRRSNRFTDIFVLRNKSWVLVAGHSSMLKPQPNG